MALRRHPLPMSAWFDHSLVVTYAYPADVLAPLLPPGLALNGYGGFGFLAVAMVQARGLRPSFLPARLGIDLILAGYRIFARLRTRDGRDLRGLRILRSDASHRALGLAGNLLTHYAFRRSRASFVVDGDLLRVAVRSGDGAADLRVDADLSSVPAPLPPGSPFPSLAVARRFAGPLPNTFDHEPATNSMIVIEGVREAWEPRPIRVAVHENGFLASPALRGCAPILANAFLVSGVPYRWKRGVVERLGDVDG
ncbi:MAG TPA: DUF2071 domain-containing protein [Planctomycetota bacterium]|nr:DUF2071 domain-containing protein [Planctomycetota bacterium]